MGSKAPTYPPKDDGKEQPVSPPPPPPIVRYRKGHDPIPDVLCDNCGGSGRIKVNRFVSFQCRACDGTGRDADKTAALFKRVMTPRELGSSGSDRCNEAFKTLAVAIEEFGQHNAERLKFITATGSGTLYVGIGLEATK